MKIQQLLVNDTCVRIKDNRMFGVSAKNVTQRGIWDTSCYESPQQGGFQYVISRFVRLHLFRYLYDRFGQTILSPDGDSAHAIARIVADSIFHAGGDELSQIHCRREHNTFGLGILTERPRIQSHHAVVNGRIVCFGVSLQCGENFR